MTPARKQFAVRQGISYHEGRSENDAADDATSYLINTFNALKG
jgi:hypothetical protein